MSSLFKINDIIVKLKGTKISKSYYYNSNNFV